MSHAMFTANLQSARRTPCSEQWHSSTDVVTWSHDRALTAHIHSNTACSAFCDRPEHQRRGTVWLRCDVVCTWRAIYQVRQEKRYLTVTAMTQQCTRRQSDDILLQPAYIHRLTRPTVHCVASSKRNRLNWKWRMWWHALASTRASNGVGEVEKCCRHVQSSNSAIQ